LWQRETRLDPCVPKAFQGPMAIVRGNRCWTINSCVSMRVSSLAITGGTKEVKRSHGGHSAATPVQRAAPRVLREMAGDLAPGQWPPWAAPRSAPAPGAHDSERASCRGAKRRRADFPLADAVGDARRRRPPHDGRGSVSPSSMSWSSVRMRMMLGRMLRKWRSLCGRDFCR